MLNVMLSNIWTNIDVLVITEANVTEEEAIAYQLKDYNQYTKCRRKRKGGGIIVYCKKNLTVETLPYYFDKAENVNLKIYDPVTKTKFIMVAVYRPPSNNIHPFVRDLDWWMKNGTKSTDSVIMMGDINICTLKKTSENSEYINVLYKHLCIPTVNKIVTREELRDGALTRSCIDHINVKLHDPNHDMVSGVIEEKISDHYWVGVQVFKKSGSEVKQKAEEKTYVQIFDDKKIKEEIQKINWDELMHYEDPEDIYASISNKFKTVYTNASMMKIKTNKDLVTPWVNSEIKTQIQKKKDLLKRWKNNKNNALVYEEYKRKRNEVTNMIKKSKRVFFFMRLREARGDMRKVWEILNQMIERGTQKSNEKILEKNFQTNDFVKLANDFNNNFKKDILLLRDKNRGPELGMDCIPHENQNTKTSFYLRAPTREEVGNIILSLKKKQDQDQTQ